MIEKSAPYEPPVDGLDEDTSQLGGHQFGGHQFGGHQFGGLMFGGWLSDVPDTRDRPLIPPVGSGPGGPEPEALDLPVDGSAPALLDWTVPVLSQQPLQSCVSSAVASVVRHLDLPGDPASGEQPAGPGPSPAFLYYNARQLEGTGRCDTGSGIRTALKALNRHGICRDDVWPSTRQFVERPHQQAYENAFYTGSVTYRRIYRLGQEPDGLDLRPVRRALANQLPVIFGFAVYDSFRAAGDGAPVVRPADEERVLFGHAAVLIGYDGDVFTAVNSWGSDWGRDGRFEISADYLADRRLAKDFWVVTSLDGLPRSPVRRADGSGAVATSA